MKTYLVSYDLNSPGKDYTKLFDAIKAFGTWWHYLDSTWIIKTDLDAGAIRDKLSPPVIDENDNLLVVRLQGNWASRLSAKANQWLTNNVSYE